MIDIILVEDEVQLATEVNQRFQSSKFLNCKYVYHNAEDALHFIPKHKPHIVLTDIGLPQKSGIFLVEQLSKILGDTQFCMFTIFQKDEKIFQSLKAGAKGYLLKTEKFEDIEKGLIELYNGGSPMSPLIARKLIQYFAENETKRSKSEIKELTQRENQILSFLSKGLLYKEIAADLSISIGTVKQHIHSIYRKLHVKNRTEAINKLNNQIH